MVAAGRGVYVGPEVAIRGTQESWRSAGDLYLSTEPESSFALFAIWKKQFQVGQIVSQFIDVMLSELEAPTISPRQNA
jgi:hypothetical protein